VHEKIDFDSLLRAACRDGLHVLDQPGLRRSAISVCDGHERLEREVCQQSPESVTRFVDIDIVSETREAPHVGAGLVDIDLPWMKIDYCRCIGAVNSTYAPTCERVRVKAEVATPCDRDT
jgi:hypothetical protein